MIKRIIAAAAIAATALLAAAGTAGAATVPQVTTACGTATPYCGTQVSAGTPGQYPQMAPGFFVGPRGSTKGQNAPVISKSDLATSETDWIWTGASGGVKTAQAAPDGVESGYCMANTDADNLILRRCAGTTWQQWQPVQEADGYAWVNVATGNYLTVTRQGKAATSALPATSLTGQQQFTFLAAPAA